MSKIPRISRRRFVQTGLCGLAVGTGLGLPLWLNSSQPLAANFIRPPGALEGDDFFAACIRCGLCVEACPYTTLRLFDYVGTPDTGTPYFVAREVACEMCVDIPCLQACPTGALDPTLTDINQAKMGTAVLSHPQLCNSYTGAAYCDSCIRACPLEDQAIFMNMGATGLGGMFAPAVDPDICTGCGKCEQACIAQPDAAIRVSRHA